MLDDPNDAAIVEIVVKLGRSLKLSVIAEGVEIEGQRDLLHKCGCGNFQGYLFGRPAPMDELMANARIGAESAAAA